MCCYLFGRVLCFDLCSHLDAGSSPSHYQDALSFLDLEVKKKLVLGEKGFQPLCEQTLPMHGVSLTPVNHLVC